VSRIVEKIVEDSKRGRDEREGLVLVISGGFARLYAGDTKIGEEEVGDFDKYWKAILLNEELDIGDPPLRHYVRSEDETMVLLMEGKTTISPELLSKILEENNVREAESIVRMLLSLPTEKGQEHEELGPLLIHKTSPALYSPPIPAGSFFEKVASFFEKVASSIPAGFEEEEREEEPNIKLEGVSLPLVHEATFSIKDPSIIRSMILNAIQDGFEIVEKGKTTVLTKEIRYGQIIVKIDHEESKLNIQFVDHFLLRQKYVIEQVLKTLLES
jgi:hypothetical protein